MADRNQTGVLADQPPPIDHRLVAAGSERSVRVQAQGEYAVGKVSMIVISCFDKSTNMVRPWAEAGYICYCVDIQHPAGETRDGNIIKVGADMKDWMPPRGEIVFAAFFPPCTHVAISGARWFRDKGLGCLIESLKLFDISIKIAEWSKAPYIIENPVSVVSTYWRKPDHTFDPCDYGDPWTKKTCLWTGNGFIMPPPKRVMPKFGSKMHLMPPSKDRADKRSETPMGFAKAVFETNRRD